MTDLAALSRLSRTLGQVIEPIAGQVYFSPECHANYVGLGFAPSPGSSSAGVAMPEMDSYFTSRGSVMGQVPGEVVAATFAVFNPDIVVPAVTRGGTLTDARSICAARDAGAIGQLERILGPSPDGVQRARELLQRAAGALRPEGRPLYAGLLSQSTPATELGATWRLGDMLREYRGDAHTGSWTSAGFDATEIGLLSELYWGLPMRSYSRTRGWTNEQFDAAAERLAARGLVGDAALTDEGRRVREEIELATDLQMRAAVEALGDDCDELFAILAPWADAVRAAHGYPAAGPQDLAEAARRRP